jgi:hypothetical protein
MYALVINPRNTEPQVMLFQGRTRAVVNAAKIAHARAHPEYGGEHLVMIDRDRPDDGPEDLAELDEMLTATGWEFYARWSPEGDHLFVTGDLHPLDVGTPPAWPRG